jgi:arylamine N-acetyltransferase
MVMAGKYAKEQIAVYYDRISLPEKLRKYDVKELSPKDALEYLKQLQKHHLISVPFENLVRYQIHSNHTASTKHSQNLHYYPHRSIVIHADELYQKIVVNKRGGYCMELNATFSSLLKSIGFTLYAAGARVNEGYGFGPFSHMANIVTIGSDRYLVDVGFGSNYVPIVPIRLINDTAGFTNIAPASARLVFKAIEGATNPYHKLWVYQHRTSEGEEWRDMYCFAAEIEFRQEDFEMMNWWTSTSRKTIFTQKVICNKMIIGDDGEIAGTIGLMRELKRRKGKESEVLKEFESEEQRVKALEKEFEIVLSEVEREAIRGTVDEIK